MDGKIENSFENGLHQDNELEAQPKGTYRNSLNGRITSRKDGSFAWESMKGNVSEFEVKTQEYLYFPPPINTLSKGLIYSDFTPVGDIEGKDKVFLFFVQHDGSLLIGYVSKETASGFTVIYYLKNNETNNKIFGKEIFTFSAEKPISGYSIYENAEIERLYFNNNDLPPLTLNIAPLLIDRKNTFESEVLQQDTAEFPWITADKLAKNYMVLSGAFYYDGILVNPGDVLTLSSDNLNSLISTPDIRIVDFYPIQNAEFDPLLKFPEISVEETITGALPCGNYVFAVSYYTKCHHYTNWSPLSRSVGIGKYFISPEPDLKYKSVLDWQKYRGGEHGTISETGLKLVLKNTETIFERIRIAAFLIDPLNELSSGKIIAEKPIGSLLFEGVVDDPVPTATVDLTFDFIQYAGIDITISEVLVSTARVEKAEEISSMLNYGILAGIQEESELSIGAKVTGTVTGLIQEIPGDVVDRLTLDTLMQNGEQALPNYPLSGLYSLDENGYVKKLSTVTDNSIGHLLPGQYYEVFESTVVYPKGSADQYAVGQRFRCKASSVPSPNDYNYTGGFVKPVFPVCKYRKNDGSRVFDWIILDDQTGLKMSGNGLAGVWGNETYRIGVLPISKSGRPMYVRWIADWQTPEREKNADGMTFEINAIENTLTSTGKHLVNRNGITGQPAPCEVYTALRYLYPLVSVDLTDIIDDISGFCIVVAPRDKKILSEGFVESVVLQDIDYEVENETNQVKKGYLRSPNLNKGNGWYIMGNIPHPDIDCENLFADREFLYITPEHLFDPTFTFDLNSILKPIRQMEKPFGWDETKIEYFSYINNYRTFHGTYYRKFYNQNSLHASIDGSSSVEFASNIATGEQEIMLNSESSKFFNVMRSTLDRAIPNEDPPEVIHVRHMAKGNKCLLVTLSSPRNWSDLPRDDGSYAKDNIILIVQQQRSVSLYNDSPESFASTKYYSVGHYQEITEEFKTSIKNSNSRYIVENIQLTGLDCHVSLFDYTRSLIQGDGVLNNASQWPDQTKYNRFMRGDTIIVPLQTSINIQSRNGRNSSYYKPSVMDSSGICYHPIYSDPNFPDFDNDPSKPARHEEFNYNWSFSNKLGQDIYPGFPINLSRLNSYEMRLRWGDKKIYGELDDVLRKYPVVYFMDVNGLFGKINNIRPNNQYLIYWQDHCVGYIPIQEKVMQSTAVGAYVQLGIGKAFEIYDELGKTYGNQDKLSLKEANELFTWFDRTNRCVIMMDRTMKLNAKSKVPGIESMLSQMNLPVCPNPFPGQTGTVYTYYDYFKRMLYMTFWLSSARAEPDQYITISLDLEKGVINGNHGFAPLLGFSSAKQLRTILDNKVYVHDDQSHLLYGQPYESYVEIVVTGGVTQFLKFVNAICVGNENFFTKVRFSANHQYDSGLYLNEVEETVNSVNYNRFLDDMRFSIPQGSKGRMEGKTMVVRFINENPEKIVKLLSMITKTILIT